MQKICQGIGHLDNALKGCRKVLLVCGGSFRVLGIRGEIESLGVTYVKFDGFSPNPLYEDVVRGVEKFRSEGCDALLAVGGGSAIDVAKCIKLYCKMPIGQFWLEQPCKDTGVRLVAVPTTAGSGSESTRFAVIYHNGKKQSVAHDSILPDVAILEPKVLATLPIYQKKCALLDALCQGIESWWSVNSTEESRRYSKMAVETIMRHWQDYIFGDTTADGDIMTAANYAGRAICITQTTAPHAFSYKITSLYRLPHGHAVAVCLPVIWQYMLGHTGKCIDGRGEEFLLSIFSQIASAMGAGSTAEAVAKFRTLLKAMDMALPESNDREKELDELSLSVNPVRLRNNPVALDLATIRGLYDMILR